MFTVDHVASFNQFRHRLGLDIGDALIDARAHLTQDALIDVLVEIILGQQRDIARINFLRRRLNWHVLGSHSRYTPCPILSKRIDPRALTKGRQRGDKPEAISQGGAAAGCRTVERL